ncbi:aminotransferase [Desulfosarcina ovata subsp. sediminis]|uniref:Aminotransferase n=1 Tax=Desulfosarcina ovata subsp. sediminis TaxID=885957 RepID=A0A5K7ZVI1_9BACT|nr:PLP-dependent aminotransferase family protein [Desulfosarcina ovata]BBO84252.1 aminotransferase [Desulfosarcina ovata subsp. sediminis]
MPTETILARRTRNMGASAIREILKVVSRPGMISLAGGIPAPESFPMDMMQEITERTIAQYGPAAFQYDLTEGFPPLREALTHYLAGKGLSATPNEVLVASGSQGVLDGLGKILISPGDHVALEAPTYLGALQAFAPYEPRYLEIATDDQGMLPDALETALARQPVKFIYMVPNFQNPTGRTLPAERRQAIADIIRRYDTLLVEDDPYGDLRYRGVPVAPIKALAPDHVVYLSTLSKVFAPGLRMGFCLAPEPVRHWLVLAKQGVDLHTSTFNQALATEYLTGGHLQRHLPRIIALYRPRQQALLGAMKRYFPGDFNWTAPEGGMFVWVRGPAGMDMQAVNRQAVARNTAFVPGTFFYARPGSGRETLRLNYTMADEPALDRAAAILGEVFSMARLEPV